MKVAIDVDGVLLDLMVEFCDIFNERYGTTYTKEDVAHWEFFHDWNVTEEVVYEIFHEIYENSEVVPFIDRNAPEILESLHQNHLLDIVSARTFRFKVELKNALETHGIIKGVHYRNLVLVENKPYDLKLTLDYDIYVDDNPNLCIPIKKSSEKILLLYDQPWNQNVKASMNVLRVMNWKEIFSYFDQI
ncbi:MAG: hypothetical protein EU548_02355 [Promethearchaeota archaeon]|nr:MAG: hypothetical protein EU548_02355 [Candidatus Lokiarchaeota archaeon]